MFNGAEAMWLSVRGGNTSSPAGADKIPQKRGAISRIVAMNSHDLHAAGEQCQGSETPPCSRPATQHPRGRRMLRFFLNYR